MAIDYASKNQPKYTATEDRPQIDLNTVQVAPFDPNWKITEDDPKQATDAPKEIEQLNQLRLALHSSVITHFRNQLSQTIAQEQVGQLLNHPLIDVELNRLINQIVLEPHQNLQDLSFKFARQLTNATLPELRRAINLSRTDPNINPVDTLQQVIEENAKIINAYQPLKDYLVPNPADPSSSLLAANIKTPITPDPRLHPTLVPEIEKIVATTSTTTDFAKQTELVETINEEITAHILTHQTIEDVNSLVKDVLTNQNLNLNSLSPQDLNHFVAQVAAYHTILSASPNIATLQAATTAQKTTPEELIEKLAQTDTSPDELVDKLQDAPPPTPVSSTPTPLPPNPASSSPDQPTPEPTPTNSTDYLGHLVTESPETTSALQQIYGFFKSQAQGFIRQGVEQATGVSVPPLTPSPTLNFPFFKNLFSPNGLNLGSLKNLKGLGNLKNLGNIFGSLGKLGKLGKLFSTAKAALLAISTSEIWIPLVIIGIIILLILLIAVLPGANTAVSTSIVPVSGGQGGAAGNSGGGYCDPNKTPELCTPLFCEGNCMCPAVGYITQGPGGSYSHTSANAIDIGISNGDPIFSISSGTVSFAGPNNQGYGNLVIVDNPDGTQVYYAHLEYFFVTTGQQVVATEQIGTGDNTGNSSGPHLHIEYKGAGAQNILNLFGFSEQQKQILQNCSSNCGGIRCEN